MAERRKTRKVRPRLREGTTAKETAVGGQGVTWPRREPDRVPGGADAVADRQGRAKASPSACFLFSPHCPLSGTGGVPWQRGEEECEGLLQDSGRKLLDPRPVLCRGRQGTEGMSSPHDATAAGE